MEEAGQGDFPARGCQMCDLAHHYAIRATADSQLEASSLQGKNEKMLPCTGKSNEKSGERGMREGRWTTLQIDNSEVKAWGGVLHNKGNFCYSSAAHICSPVSLTVLWQSGSLRHP